MKTTITRYMQNRTYVHGRMTVEGTSDVFETMELAIPQDRFSYVKHCLPPGKYTLNVELSVIAIKEGSVRRPWPLLKKIKWFPHAAIYSSFEDHSLISGRIFVGASSNDEWSVEQSDMVTAKIASALQRVYDPSNDTSTEPVILEIIESPDLVCHDYDRQQYERELRAQEELRQKAEAEARMQELMQVPS